MCTAPDHPRFICFRKKSQKSRRQKFSRQSGFLLLDLVIAMGVLIFITVSMYQIIYAGIEATKEIEGRKVRYQELQGLAETLRKAFRTIPNDARIQTSVNDSASGAALFEIRITEAPTTLAIGHQEVFYGTKVLAQRPQLGGLFNLSFFTEETLEGNPNPILTPELPLVTDIQRVEWLFYDDSTGNWERSWESTATRPRLIRMAILQYGEAAPFEAIFHLPSLSNTQGGAP